MEIGMRHAWLLCLFLGACSGGAGDPGEISAADQAQATALFDSYDAARSSENWEVAESHADKLRDQFPGSDAAAKLAASIEQVRAQAEQARESRRLGELWDYQSVAVGKGVQRSAAIYNLTVPAEEGQPVPTPDAQLVLRDHPSWGRSAYLLLAQSRFSCGSPCAMQIRFDDGQARRYSGKQADSGKGPALFIEDEHDFIDAMSNAERVRIELPKGSGRIPALVFEVAGYDPGRFERPGSAATPTVR
jgi:hypothetical protein